MTESDRSPEGNDQDRARLGAFVMAMRARGITDMRVLGAIETTPRRLFVPAAARNRDFDDRPIGIECGQSISAPSLIAQILQAADLQREHRILDIGTGSGFLAAVAALLVAEVYTVDRYKTLVDLARDRFSALKRDTIVADCRDGLLGWPEHAPYDRILVSAAVAEIPPPWLEQLAPGGILIAPIGAGGSPQALTRIVKAAEGTGIESDVFGEVRLVSLVPGRAGHL